MKSQVVDGRRERSKRRRSERWFRLLLSPRLLRLMFRLGPLLASLVRLAIELARMFRD